MDAELKIELDGYERVLEERIAQKTSEVILLQKLRFALKNESGLGDVLQMIVNGVKSIFNYASAAVFLVTDDERHMVLKSFAIDSEKLRLVEKATGLRAKGYKLPLFEGSVFKRVFETGEPFSTEDAVGYFEQWTDREDLRPLAAVVAEIMGNGVRIVSPLIVGDRVIGMIVGSIDRVFLPQDLQGLKGFGREAGLAIAWARLFDEWLKKEDLKRYLRRAKDIVNGKNNSV